jgi:hypothetical protein
MKSPRELSPMARNAWASVVLGIALNAGGCSTNGATCNLPGPVTVNTDASTDGLPVDGNYGSVGQCAQFCDPSRSSCQRLGDSQVRCSNDRVGCL